MGWEEAAKEAAERYKNAFAELAKHDIMDETGQNVPNHPDEIVEVTQFWPKWSEESIKEETEKEPLDKEGDDVLSLESETKVDFQPPKRHDNWGLGRQP